MREILFRGKRIDNGEWVEGWFVNIWTGTKYVAHIHTGMYVNLVNPSTVGQYTGLTDKNGKKIFEGDIVSAWSAGSHGNFAVKWRQEASPCFILYPAFNGHELWSLHGCKGGVANTKRGNGYSDDVEIIGNIHDNPELLKGEK